MNLNKKRVILENKLKKLFKTIILQDDSDKNIDFVGFVNGFRYIMKCFLESKTELTFSEIISKIAEKFPKIPPQERGEEIIRHIEKCNYNTKKIYNVNFADIKKSLSNLFNCYINYSDLDKLELVYSKLNDYFKERNLFSTNHLRIIEIPSDEDNNFLGNCNNLSSLYSPDEFNAQIVGFKEDLEKKFIKLIHLGISKDKIISTFSLSGISNELIESVISEMKGINSDSSDNSSVNLLKELPQSNLKRLNRSFKKYLKNGYNPFQIINLLKTIGWSDYFINMVIKNNNLNIYSYDGFDEKVDNYSKSLKSVYNEVSKVIVGQKDIIRFFILAIIADGNVLIEGAPGLAKTTIIRVLTLSMECDFNRIQFTADLLPSDIIGFNAYNQEDGFSVVKGPVFTNILLADEINRASAKVQSALLECMAEKEVSIGKETYNMDLPFFVFATQNPIESLGTYPLPQAQLDRFIFKLNIDYPNLSEEFMIVDKNINTKGITDFNVKSVLTPKRIIEMQEFVKNIYISPLLKEYIVKIIDATRSWKKYDLELGEFLEWGAGPRATIALFNAVKANALYNKRSYVIDQDIKDIVYITLRHRVLLNYEGQAKHVKPEHLIKEILSKVPLS